MLSSPLDEHLVTCSQFRHGIVKEGWGNVPFQIPEPVLVEALVSQTTVEALFSSAQAGMH